MKQREWNQYEAIILLSSYIDVMVGKVSQRDAISQVSRDLRRLAVNQGENIDETFRNENGIYFQMQSMDSAFKGYTVSKPATKLFSDTVKLYRKNNSEYKSLLATAKTMTSGKIISDEDDKDSLKAEFMNYLRTKVSPSQVNESLWCYDEIEKYCLKRGLLDKPLFETTNIEQLKDIKEIIDKSPSFRFTHRGTNTKLSDSFYYYYTFIKEKAKEKSQEKVKEETKEKKTSTRLTPNSDESMMRTKEDERLLSKYPIIFKRIFYVLRDSSLSEEGLTLNKIQDLTQRIARVSDIEDILDNASWVDFKENRYWFSNEIVDHNFIEAKTEQNTKLTNRIAESIDASHVKKNYQNESFETILKGKFRQGFRMNSPIEIRRFRKAYFDAYDKELQEDDAKIINTICRLCIINKDRAYLPEEILSDDLTVKLLDYIEKSFDEGKTILYYSAVCDEFEEDFLNFPLHDNPELLRQYLGVIGNEKFYLSNNFISQDPKATPDILTEIRSCLIESARPMKFEEIFEVLPHLPQDKVKWLLRSNKEFVNNGPEEYFHESIVCLSDEELENIAEIINLTLEEKDFISGNELYNAIGEKYRYILDENQEISAYGFRDALKVKFGDRYSFNGNVISKFGNSISMAKVFGDFAKNRDSFTLAELRAFAEELGTSIYFDPVYENSLRISQEQFVSTDQAYFPITETDAVLDMVCSGNYISIQNVNNFGIFPDAGHTWNNFLLEEYVYEYSEKYMLLHFRFNQFECVGAIVKRSAGYNNFDDFVVDFLSNADVELKKEPALELLAREGYIARRRYSNIESLLIRAKAQRSNKEMR